MKTEITRPGTLPAVLLHAPGWQPNEVRRVSYEMNEWRAVLVTDDAGPVGAVCFTEPSIYPALVVDTVIVHPDRPVTEAQLLSLALPILRQYATRFRATKIVFEAAGEGLRKALADHDAKEEAVTMSVGMDSPCPAFVAEQPVEAVSQPAFLCPCGKSYPKKNYLTNHQKHCANAKGT